MCAQVRTCTYVHVQQLVMELMQSVLFGGSVVNRRIVSMYAMRHKTGSGYVVPGASRCWWEIQTETEVFSLSKETCR